MKKALFLVLAAVLILFISCQSSQTTVPEQEPRAQWVNSNIYGNWPEAWRTMHS